MGLDMYLSAKHYVGNQYRDKNKKVKIKQPKELDNFNRSLKSIDVDNITYIEEELGYWRKANHIHNWFIQNCADGEDDCRDVYVPIDKLKELKQVCEDVLENTKLVKGTIRNGYHFNEDGQKVYDEEEGEVVEDSSYAKEHLPTTSGFFFGSEDYDKWYIEDIKNTIKIIDNILNREVVPDDVYYRASW